MRDSVIFVAIVTGAVIFVSGVAAGYMLGALT